MLKFKRKFRHLKVKKSLCTWRLQYSTQLMSWRWPSQNTFGMWTVLYWTRSSRTNFGVSINVLRVAGDTLNITCNFLYCNHQVHRDFLNTLYYNLMGPPLYMRSVVDRNVVTRRMTVLILCLSSCGNLVEVGWLISCAGGKVNILLLCAILLSTTNVVGRAN